MDNIAKNPARDYLGKQYLIVAFIEQRLALVNYIKKGYDNNTPVLMTNRFLHFTAHGFYRSIILDLYALYGKPTNDNRYAFGHIKTESFPELNPNSIREAETIIKGLESSIVTITKIRHQQIAHYNFEKEDSISLNFDQLPALNKLFTSAVEIIKLLGVGFLLEEERMGFDFEQECHYVRSLQHLIERS
ncbi:MAG: hypothetical protein JNM88_17255 [Chitinophagaceae bacterium]|nr:hypothetical protein [Chitinophagaceae bacterium]